MNNKIKSNCCDCVKAEVPPSRTPRPTITPTRTPKPSFTPTRKPKITITPTVTRTPSQTRTNTPTVTATPTKTKTLTPTKTQTVTLTTTPAQTQTATATLTATPAQTQTATATLTSTPTKTATPAQTQTATATLTATPTKTATLTPTPTPTSTRETQSSGGSTFPASPSNLIALEGNQAIDLSWSAPTNPRGDAFYLVAYRPTSATNWQYIVTSVSSIRRTLIAGLTNDTEYEIKVGTANGSSATDIAYAVWSLSIFATPTSGSAPQQPTPTKTATPTKSISPTSTPQPTPTKTVTPTPTRIITWTARASNQPWVSIACSSNGNKIIAVADAIYISNNGGITWTTTESNRQWESVACSSDGNKIIAVANGSAIYISNDGGITWTAKENSRGWNCVACSKDGTKMFAGTNYGPNGTDDGRIYVSTNGGENWSITTGIYGSFQSVKYADDTNEVLVCGRNYFEDGRGYLWLSGNLGSTWFTTGYVRAWQYATCSSDCQKIIAVAQDGTLDIGNRLNGTFLWNTPLKIDYFWKQVICSDDGNKIIAISPYKPIYISNDGGVNWTTTETSRNWAGGTCSSDGTKIIAISQYDKIYTNL